MAQVLALEMDVRAAEVLAQARRGVQRRGAADKSMPVTGELDLGVGLGLVPHVLELFERAHQCLGHVLSAVGAEPAVDRVREGSALHQLNTSASLTACTNARTLSGSLTRIEASTPLETSTP